jgi:integrase
MIRTKSGLPKHCSWNSDRHGTRRVRFRKGGFSTYLFGTPWSEDFMRQYAAALDGVTVQASNIGAERTIVGTVNALVAAYLDPNSSSPFKTLGKETRRTRRCALESFRRAHGNKPLYRTEGTRRVMLLTREHVQRIINEKASTPFAQHNLLKTLRAMFEWAVGEGRIPDNPTLGVKRVKVKTAGWKSWSEDEIACFEGTHAIGTKARLAFGLILYTGQRKSDVIRMGAHHIHNGVLTIDQGKTEGGEEAHLEIPVHPKLREIIDSTPTLGVKTFLVTNFGKPFTPAGFGNWFRDRCDEAGCHDISAHGGRKATARRLAEIGCSAQMIAAITGHASLREVQRYAAAADRKRLAREAMKKLTEGGW